MSADSLASDDAHRKTVCPYSFWIYFSLVAMTKLTPSVTRKCERLHIGSDLFAPHACWTTAPCWNDTGSKWLIGRGEPPRKGCQEYQPMVVNRGGTATPNEDVESLSP